MSNKYKEISKKALEVIYSLYNEQETGERSFDFENVTADTLEIGQIIVTYNMVTKIKEEPDYFILETLTKVPMLLEKKNQSEDKILALGEQSKNETEGKTLIQLIEGRLMETGMFVCEVLDNDLLHPILLCKTVIYGVQQTTNTIQ